MLKLLKTVCDNCTLCRLGQTRPEVRGQKIDPHVFSNMNSSKYMIFGQNPGYNECLQDEPFVGQSGKTFDAEIAKHSLDRSHFYITNVLHCYTENNRAPLPEELKACRPLVQMELLYLKPKLIITLGKFAFNTFCPDKKYGDCLGTIQKAEISGKKLNVFPIYHPSPMNLIKTRKIKFEKDVALMCKLIKHWDQQNLTGQCQSSEEPCLPQCP